MWFISVSDSVGPALLASPELVSFSMHPLSVHSVYMVGGRENYGAAGAHRP